MSESRPTRILCVGLGAIGHGVLDQCRRRGDVEVAGAIDPARAGERIGDLEVLASIEQLDDRPGDVAVLATGSHVPTVCAQATELLARGLHVVSSCEALVHPWLSHADVASELDAAARQHGRVVVGTGVNPGFVMDVVPVLALSVCAAPTAIAVTRSVDLDRRRPQLPAKLGVGCTEREWHERAGRGELGHAGLVESAALCAVGAGWDVPDVEFARSPLVEGGVVVGIREAASIDAGDGRAVRLELVFRHGGTDVDRIVVDGEAGVALTLEGVHGDRATVARLVQAASVVAQMPAGLRLPIELPGWSGVVAPVTPVAA